MNKRPVKSWKRKAIVIVSLMSIPLTIYASNEPFMHVWSYSHIGGYYSGLGQQYSTDGLLIVGNGITLPSGGVGTNDSIVAGKYLNLYDSNSFVLGRYNRDSQGDELFVIGNGSSTATAQNEVEILKDGTIRLGGDSSGVFALEIASDGKTITIDQPQGDLSMGIYQ